MKLLLVEDDVQVAQLMATAFDAEGHEVVVCHSGEEALRHLEHQSHQSLDAVFLDVKLPSMSGIEVLRAIRSSARPGLPVILVTGHATPKQLAEARRLGVTDILEKPYVLNHFSTALRRVKSDRKA